MTRAKIFSSTSHSQHGSKVALLINDSPKNFVKRPLHLATTRLTLAAVFGLLSGPARAGLEEGVAAYQAGNLPLAVSEFRTAAEKGEADCQFNLALMYEQGIGMAKDEKQAVVWYRKSAEQGNSNAQFNLGVLYENGRGTAVDFAQATTNGIARPRCRGTRSPSAIWECSICEATG